MTRKIAFVGIGLLLLISPVFVKADTLSDLQAQIQALLAQIAILQGQSGGSGTTAPGLTCVILRNSLSVDDTDAATNGEVTKLQQFLAGHGYSVYPEARITGYFGPATMRAVQRWQRMKGIVSSGDPDSTGYGFVGARTRTAMGCGLGLEVMPPSAVPVPFVAVSPPNDTAASLTASVVSGQSPLAVTLSGVINVPSNQGGTGIIFFGDGTSDIVQRPTPTAFQETWSHTYYTGEYDVLLVYSSVSNIDSDIQAAKDPYYYKNVVTRKLHISVGSAQTATSFNGVTLGVRPDNTTDTFVATANLGQWTDYTWELDWGEGDSSAQTRYSRTTTVCNSSWTCSAPGGSTHTYRSIGDFTVTLYAVKNGVRRPVAAAGVRVSVLGTVSSSAPTIYSFSGSAVSVSAGQPVTFSWSSNAANCHLWQNESNGGYGAIATNAGSATSYVVYPTVSKTYTLNCFYMPDGSGKDGANTSKTFYVSVSQPVNPSVSLYASPTSLIAGQYSTLSWSSTNTNRCYLSNTSQYEPWTEQVGTGGSKSVKPSQSTTYRLVCSNDPGTGKDGPSAESSATVSVTYPGTTFSGSGVYVNSSLRTTPNAPFILSGTETAAGPFKVVLVEIKYAGATDWTSVSNTTKDGSGFRAVANQAAHSNGNWSVPFSGLQEGYYHLYIYDVYNNLKGSGYFESSWKG